ncbi:MAG TPA: DUF4430 domain-containing protein [Pirellulales bacterium]|nr:DUF4430 domain-containing protein [Pirellulales bacterium]
MHRLAIAITVLVSAMGCRDRTGEKPAATTTNAPAATNAANAKTIQLTIDFGDGAEKRLTAIPFHGGMTVLDALEAAKHHPHGITFASRGSGGMTLVTKIDDVANQEGAAGGKNWLFFVNGKLSDRGCGAASVNPGDSILWRYQVNE